MAKIREYPLFDEYVRGVIAFLTLELDWNVTDNKPSRVGRTLGLLWWHDSVDIYGFNDADNNQCVKMLNILLAEKFDFVTARVHNYTTFERGQVCKRQRILVSVELLNKHALTGAELLAAAG